MSRREPLAIVGMACRFPGGVNDPDAFWELLRDGVDAVTEVPEERWNAARFHHANAAAPGRMVTRWGGFAMNADAVDAAFFGIAPREAARLDPQHRWLMEVSWEAMEDAGLPPEELAGTRTGVFVGISQSDYVTLLRQETHLLDGYANIGSALCIAANRLSFLFNLRGPSFAVDTACSSSLVALHLAAQSLRAGECDYALVAAANELLSPESSIGFSQAHMLSPNGRSRAFDAGADGYVRAEGAGAVLLMPLGTAQERGLQPRALLVGTACNQDGRSSSLTVPSQQAQEQMLREALQSAGAHPRDIVYVETHGTGTPVGDPVEARAIAAVFGDGRERGGRLLIGSVKTNIGHLESASGIAGLIKAVLVLEQRTVPPNLHFSTPNPLVPIDRVEIPTAIRPLPSRNGLAPLVAVNSFGFGGTNAHALLAPQPAIREPTEESDQPQIFPVSARSSAALAQYARNYADFIEQKGRSNSLHLRDLCAAAALGKSHHPLREAFVADSLQSLQTQLVSRSESATSPASGRPKIAFVFSGQGPQWWAMGRQLYEQEKIVRDIWEQCDSICRKLGGPNLLAELLATEAESQLGRTDIAQPALFALQAGVTAVWRAWGIEADVIIGHSVGEAAAAWAAGIFDLEGIYRVIIGRSRWQAKLHGLGRMLAAGISAADASGWEKKFAGRISVAAYNAPQQVTLSGETGALEEIAAALQEAEFFSRFLPADYAFHSAQMDAIETGLREELNGVAGETAKVPMISTVTGQSVAGPDLNADYWWQNVRQPVQFSAGVERLLREGCTALIEIGPHPVMASALAEIVHARKSPAIAVASLRRGEKERSTMLHGLASLYRHGVNVRWPALYHRPARPLRLPPYPWQRQRLWHESTKAWRELRAGPPHPLLGDRQADPQPTWISHLDARLAPWLSDHRLAGAAVLPAAAYLEMAAAAVREFLGEPTIFLEEIRFHHLLFLPDDQPVPVCVRLDPAFGSFQIFAAPPDNPAAWKLHADGRFRPGRLRPPARTDLDLLAEGLPDECDPQTIYREWREIGQVFGPAFQGLKSLRRHGCEALAAISSPTERESASYLLFPPLLDSAFHSSAAIEREQTRNSRGVVASVREIRIFQALPEKAWSHARLAEHGGDTYFADIALLDEHGTVLAQIGGLAVRAIDSGSAGRERQFYQMVWEPAAEAVKENQGEQAAEVLILADRAGFGLQLAESLRARNVPATVVLADAKRPGSNGHSLAIDVREDDWASELWRTLAARGSLPGRVIYLWGSDEARPDARICSAFFALVQARLAADGSENAGRWLVVTRQAQLVQNGECIVPADGALWGFVRTVQSEYPLWQISLVDCAEGTPPEALLSELFAAEIEPEVALRGDQRQVRRLRHFQPQTSGMASDPPAYSLEIGQTGRTDSLEFRGSSRAAPGPGEVEIEVAAAGLNFRDLMKVLGIYPLQDGEPANLGDECSGRVLRVGRGVRKVKPGDRVMVSSLTGGTFSSHVIMPVTSVWKIPNTLDFADAAAIPVVFGTAYHGLITLAQLRRGETVLIHAATGGVGLAAVQLAQQIGALVLATAGSEEKRAYLYSLGVALVMDSRTLDFAEETLRYTGGRGVDVVLNSLAGAFQEKSLAICAPHGRFVEIGKRDLFEKKGLPLAAFQRSLSFFTFDLPSVMASRGPQKHALVRFLATGFARGKLKPIRRTTFPARDAIPAFRLMQSAQHIGKIILEFDRQPAVAAEFWPDRNSTYLITGGLSGFGLATARWLVERGATHLALLSRRGVPSAQDAPTIDGMRSRGVTVVLLSVDIADAGALAAALRRLKKSSPPLRGVFHAAMVLRDRALAELTRDDLEAVLAPKITGAWNLHLQTRDLPLDCFVLFSSLSSLIGSPGQANYAAANAFLDTLADYRRAMGLPALSVNWGQISDVGVVADRPEIGRYLEGIGVGALSSKEALAALPRLIASGQAQAGVMNVNWEKLALASAKFSTSPVFRDLIESVRANRATDHAASHWRETVLRLTPEEQLAAVSDLVVAQLAATFGMAPAQIDRSRPLAELGMDSLMAVELKSRIESHTGSELPVSIFNSDLTAERLAERFARQINKSSADRTAALSSRSAAPAPETAPLLRTDPTPLRELVRAGKLGSLTAAALMPWPNILLEQLEIPAARFFEHMGGGRVSLDLILETPLGAVGIFMLPLTTAQVNPGEPLLLPHLLEGIKLATACGARCVALTGLIPSATGYGAAVQEACKNRGDLAAATTGHATTIAAVVLNLDALLKQAGRRMPDETVMFYGIGSIGLGALQLMLAVLPHPAELRLCDPYRSTEYFAELERSLRREHGFTGAIRVAHPGGNRDLYDATVIVGATNVENVIDVSRLAPGTLVVDDSWPHCLNGPSALARFHQHGDILLTEGGFVRNGAAMPRIAHLPASLASVLPADLPNLLFASLNPNYITACILSALISAHRPELAPTIGLVDLATTRRHWAALSELGFSAAELNYEGTALPPAGVAAFRARFGRQRSTGGALTTAAASV